MDFLLQFIKTNNIHIMGLTETRWKGSQVDKYFPEYQWFGRKTTDNTGGVGYLIHDSVISGKKIAVKNGKNKNSLLIHIESTHRTRGTIFLLVYGKSSPTREETKR